MLKQQFGHSAPQNEEFQEISRILITLRQQQEAQRQKLMQQRMMMNQQQQQQQPTTQQRVGNSRPMSANMRPDGKLWC
jgi:hypothetical protein